MEVIKIKYYIRNVNIKINNSSVCYSTFGWVIFFKKRLQLKTWQDCLLLTTSGQIMCISEWNCVFIADSIYKTLHWGNNTGEIPHLENLGGRGGRVFISPVLSSQSKQRRFREARRSSLGFNPHSQKAVSNYYQQFAQLADDITSLPDGLHLCSKQPAVHLMSVCIQPRLM